jgi:hypothetical protein
MSDAKPMPGDTLDFMRVTTHEDGKSYLVEGHDRQVAYEQFGQDITVQFYTAVLLVETKEGG